MKSKISLILGIVLLFLSLPFMMGNGETESPKDKDAIQKELDQIYDVVMKAYDKMLENQAGFDTTQAEKDKMKEIISDEIMLLFGSHPDKLPSVDELAAILDEKRRSSQETTTTLAEFQARIEEIEDQYYQYSENKGPGYFESEESLQEWIDSLNSTSEPSEPENTTDEINQAREQQAAALDDGYVINTNFFNDHEENKYVITNTTNVNGTMYWWRAGSSDVKPTNDLGVRVLRNFRWVEQVKNWVNARSVRMDLTNATEEEWEKIGEQIVEAGAKDGFIIHMHTYCTEERGVVKYSAICSVDTGDNHKCIWTVGGNNVKVMY